MINIQTTTMSNMFIEAAGLTYSGHFELGQPVRRASAHTLGNDLFAR